MLLTPTEQRVQGVLEREDDSSSEGSVWEDMPVDLRSFSSSMKKGHHPCPPMRQSASLVCLSSYFQDAVVCSEYKDNKSGRGRGHQEKAPLEDTLPTHPLVVSNTVTGVVVIGPPLSDQSDTIKTTSTLSSLLNCPVKRTDESLLEDLLDAVDCSQWKLVSAILETNPQLARHPVSMVVQGENSNCLLVHLLAGLKDTPVAVIDQLVTLHPSSLLQAESRAGRLPIHIAIVKESHPELVRYLCRARPQALQRPDQEGNFPLHYAAMYGGGSSSSPEVLQVLLQAYPQACAHANTRDRYPIHLVCARCYDDDEDNKHHDRQSSRMSGGTTVPTEDLETMIQAYPAALKQVDRFGRTPLHLACSILHPQWNLLQLLIEYAPECLWVKDKARQTPLQCAARQGKRWGNDLVVASLMEATQQERKRHHKGRWFVLSSLSRHRNKDPPAKDLYCCYG